jgi:1-acyl-sn-glycerol-3-phosphate acyltransferase
MKSGDNWDKLSGAGRVGGQLMVADRKIFTNPSKDLGVTLARAVYFPYEVVFFLPFLGTSTLFWGATAWLIARRNPHLGFHCGTAWAWSLCRANFTRVTVEGREKADPNQSYVIMSNHQSHFDVLAFYGHWGRQFRWVMKQELRKVPGLGPACEAIGHIYVDRSDHQKAIASLQAARRRLEPGVSILFFPEGSRSNDGSLGPFKKGGFVMAQQMGLPILPVTITGSHAVLPSHSFNLLPGTIRIQVHQPIDTMAYAESERERLMEDVRAAIASGL